jgi:inhibitor of KinA
MNNHRTFEQFGEHGVLISWPSKIDPSINEEVLKMDASVTAIFSEEIIETVPAYHSLAVYLRSTVVVTEFIAKLKKISSTSVKIDLRKTYIVTIPVCYDIEFAPDMEEVATIHDITVDEVIKIHTEPFYKVYFLGFLPGFPYLGGLSEKLNTPRKKTVRKFVEKGSVAIGGNQTGIYTMESPGGWNIIGRSPLLFFSTSKGANSLLNPGDFVRFTPVSLEEFNDIKREIELGNYEVKKEVRND